MTTPLIPVMLAGFAATTCRVVVAVLAEEEFTAEPTLALISAVVLAFLVSLRVARHLRAASSEQPL